jgi:hypothetical protein
VAHSSIGRLAQPCGTGLTPEPKSPANKAVWRSSSPSVAVPDSACHGGGRGFESRRSRLEKCLKSALTVACLGGDAAPRHTLPHSSPSCSRRQPVTDGPTARSRSRQVRAGDVRRLRSWRSRQSRWCTEATGSVAELACHSRGGRAGLWMERVSWLRPIAISRAFSPVVGEAAMPERLDPGGMNNGPPLGHMSTHTTHGYPIDAALRRAYRARRVRRRDLPIRRALTPGLLRNGMER